MRKAALMVWISLLVQGQYCMMDLLLFLLLLLCCTLCMFCSLLPVSHGAQGYYARKLLNDLMENYSNALRPVEDTDAALNVSLQITLSQIKDMVNNQSVNQSSYPSIYLRYLSIHPYVHPSIHPSTPTEDYFDHMWLHSALFLCFFVCRMRGTKFWPHTCGSGRSGMTTTWSGKKKTMMTWRWLTSPVTWFGSQTLSFTTSQ